MRGVRRVLVLALVLAACGGGQDGGASGPLPLATSAIEGIRGRFCDYVTAPAELPVFDELARPGARGNVALWGRDLAARDSVELSVRYGDDGRLEWVRAIRSTLPGERTGALERLVLESLAETGPGDWGVRLYVIGGDIAGLAPSVVCQPEREAMGPSVVAFPVTPSGRSVLFQARGTRFPVQVTLDDQGRVLDVELARRSGHPEVDQFLVDYVRSSSFRPKLHDGIGVYTTFDYYIRMPRRS